MTSRRTRVLTTVFGMAAMTWAVVPGPRLAAQPAPAAGFAGAEAAIRAAMQKSGIPGAAVAVVVGDTVVWSRGFGVANAETGAAVTADTLFQIGSVTKAFTAAALIAAATEGAVALEKPVATYVSGLTRCVGAPTLTQLLSHTAASSTNPTSTVRRAKKGWRPIRERGPATIACCRRAAPSRIRTPASRWPAWPCRKWTRSRLPR